MITGSPSLQSDPTLSSTHASLVPVHPSSDMRVIKTGNRALCQRTAIIPLRLTGCQTTFFAKLENPIPDGAIKIDDKNASVPGVQAFVNSLPGLSGNYTVSAGGWGTDDYIEIKDKDGNVVITSPDFSSKQPPDSWWQSIYDLSTNLTSLDDKALITQGKRTVSSGKRTSKKQAKKKENQTGNGTSR